VRYTEHMSEKSSIPTTGELRLFFCKRSYRAGYDNHLLHTKTFGMNQQSVNENQELLRDVKKSTLISDPCIGHSREHSPMFPTSRSNITQPPSPRDTICLLI
jgi:hypothetical protein